jgi:hypothetical protein
MKMTHKFYRYPWPGTVVASLQPYHQTVLSLRSNPAIKPCCRFAPTCIRLCCRFAPTLHQAMLSLRSNPAIRPCCRFAPTLPTLTPLTAPAQLRCAAPPQAGKVLRIRSVLSRLRRLTARINCPTRRLAAPLVTHVYLPVPATSENRVRKNDA